jgi:hypothetical protein
VSVPAADRSTCKTAVAVALAMIVLPDRGPSDSCPSA